MHEVTHSLRSLERSSAYKEWTTIVAFWRWAAQVEEFGGAVPMCPTERLRKSDRDPNKKAPARGPVVAASWEQAARCIAAATDWVRPLAILCYYTGLRVGQARSLTWDHVHLDVPCAKENGGPVLWVGQGKTPAEADGRFLPLHPSLAGWLRQRRGEVPTVEALSRDLRRTDTAAYKARAAGLAEGRIAWEGGNQNLSLQFCRAWKKAEVPAAVWELRPGACLPQGPAHQRHERHDRARVEGVAGGGAAPRPRARSPVSSTPTRTTGCSCP